MKTAISLAWLSAICALVLADGLSKYASPEDTFTRPPQDLKMVETRQQGPRTRPSPPVHHSATRKQGPRQPAQVVYGKPIFLDPQQKASVRQPATRTNQKFRPSPEDPFLYAPGQTYLQKYANQLYTAQKNAGQLSEYQKYILNQDPAVKGYVFPDGKRKPKLASVEVSTAASRVVTTTVAPTEKVKIAAKPKRKEKKVEAAEDADNAAQSTAYKFVFQPEYVPVYTSNEKDLLSLYPQPTQFTPSYPQYVLGHTPSAHALPAVTYHGVTGHNAVAEEHHEYPTKEPKYEFKYEVKDHAKNSNFGHSETRKGKTTWGKYFVQLSDGRLETVKYWADKTGYHAEVDFKGHAQHPASKEHPVTHGYAAEDVKLYVSPTPLVYAVSEQVPVDFH